MIQTRRFFTLAGPTLLIGASACAMPHLFPGMGEPSPLDASAAKFSKPREVPSAPRPIDSPTFAVPEVVREPVASLPLELVVDRGQKLAASAQLTDRGAALFAANCSPCHGAKGEGNGPASFAAEPRPRNYTKGIFKLHSNESGSLPLDEDLFDTITRGMPGSAMPSFVRLSTDDRWALVEAVKSLAVFKDEDEGIEVHFFKDRPPSPAISIGPAIPTTPDAVSKGNAAFQKLECWKCHGTAKDGNGPSSTDLKDAWGDVTWPRDFHDAAGFRGVASIRDLVVRVRTGLSGTPMPAVGATQASDEELWALAHSTAAARLGRPSGEPAPGGTLVATRCPEPIPADLRQARFWLNVPAYVVALTGNGPKTARVAIQRDAARVALLVSWDDPFASERSVVIGDFFKGVTVELTSSGGALDTWEWRSEWMRDAAKRPTGAFGERGANAAKLEGTGCWAQGEWRVLFERPLAGVKGEAGLAGRTIDVTLSVQDMGSTTPRISKSATVQLAVP